MPIRSRHFKNCPISPPTSEAVDVKLFPITLSSQGMHLFYPSPDSTMYLCALSLSRPSSLRIRMTKRAHRCEQDMMQLDGETSSTTCRTSTRSPSSHFMLRLRPSRVGHLSSILHQICQEQVIVFSMLPACAPPQATTRMEPVPAAAVQGASAVKRLPSTGREKTGGARLRPFRGQHRRVNPPCKHETMSTTVNTISRKE